MALMSMGGRFAWWKTNLGASARILAADPDLAAGGALAAGKVGVLTAVPGPAHDLNLAASAGLTPGQDGNPTRHQRERLATLNPQRSLAHALANHTVPLRAKSHALAQTLASHAPRADPKSKGSESPGVVPRRNLPVGSPEAAHVPIQGAETENASQDLHLAEIVSSPCPQASALHPAQGLALDPGPATQVLTTSVTTKFNDSTPPMPLFNEL